MLINMTKTTLTKEEQQELLKKEIKTVTENLFIEETQYNFYSNLAGMGERINTKYLNTASTIKGDLEEKKKYLEHLDRELKKLD